MAKKNRVRVYNVHGVRVLSFGRVEIWDGADMALLRETLTRLVEVERARAIGIDLTHVKFIPGGFFGLLDQYRANGVEVRLYAPQPHVRRMLWFQLFFEEESPGCFRMVAEPKENVTLPAEVDGPVRAPWADTADQPTDADRDRPDNTSSQKPTAAKQ